MAGGIRRAKALVVYDGTRYHGFEWQKGVPTIQGEIEEALLAVTGERIRIVGAGRTDAGVHATGQVISLMTSWDRPWEILTRALNANLPPDIAVWSLEEAPPDFHARRGAKSRVYRYTIYNSRTRNPLTRLFALQWPEPLDVEAMSVALGNVVGEHDFRAFGTSPSGKSTVRRVHRADCFKEGEYIYIELEADAFLRHMVRRIVAALLQVGQGKMSPEEFRRILEQGNPDQVKGMAPAHGLCLTKVNY